MRDPEASVGGIFPRERFGECRFRRVRLLACGVRQTANCLAQRAPHESILFYMEPC